MFSQQIIQAGFAGLGAFGANGQAALRGSVVDVAMDVGDANRVLFYTSAMGRSLVDRLNSSGFHVVNFDDSNLGGYTGSGGGSLRARVQILTDGYASARDAASVVAGAASYLGYNVTGFTGTLVSSGSQATTPGITQSGQQFDPNTVPPVKPAGAPKTIADYLSDLTSSPTSLAVILGAAVILVIAAKK